MIMVNRVKIIKDGGLGMKRGQELGSSGALAGLITVY